MLTVIGQPVGRRSNEDIVGRGLAVAIAREAARAGSAVQLVGKVGEGADGDAIVLSIAEARIGHAALLRGPVPVPIIDDRESGEPDASVDRLAELDAVDGAERPEREAATGSALDAADVTLALRYLPDYGVVVVADPLPEETLAAVVDAARWAEARLVVVTTGGQVPPALPDDATVLEAPTEDAEGAFATLVGRYAAALDQGVTPAEAFAAASAEAGWAVVEA